MRTIGVVANCGKERAADVVRRLAVGAGRLGLSLLADEATAALSEGLRAFPLDEVLGRADAIMALGGDGTLLRAVRALGGRDLPVIGVNIGWLGFLTSVAEEDLDRALECLATDRYEITTAALAEARVLSAARETAVYRALNDVVIRASASRVITLEVHIDGDYLTSYVCDGLIVSTPSGSTGYSLSAGGPILSPETPAFVISLICPHTLSSRPLVVPDGSAISVRTATEGDCASLSVDGQVGQVLRPDDRVVVRRAAEGVRFVRLPGYSYYGVLRQKLKWSGSSADPKRI